MKITTVKRDEFKRREFMGGMVSPEIDLSDENSVDRDEIAKGLVIDSTWYELPDNPEGTYVLVERLSTNEYGYFDNGKSKRELLSLSGVEWSVNMLGRGILNQIGIVTISGEDVVYTPDERELARKQGV